MARIYSHKKGKHGSRRPLREGAPGWVEYKAEELEKLVLKLRQRGMTSAMIGTVLRDQYGVPSVQDITGKKIQQILAANKMAPKMPEDILNLLRRVVAIQEHLAKNKADAKAKKGLEFTESKIRRLAKYYKREGKLPDDWQYDASKAKLLIQQ